nr:protein EMSY-LIKE 3-like isoform X1 [Ipomoea batatas]GMC84348.1 protein EMSY-LIKE 3-like isoform X1 [Ipomoea batatas]GMC90291.1 protein EMSY-LIKE 3-like isoform X1 [Ipomoea batatas]
MDYEVIDSSGTDDDLPQSQYNRAPTRSIVGNGRSNVGSAIYQRMHSDMEAQIHNLEQEAYGAVLRAFKAQSDALTWEKEGLITELRKELRVSDDEHRDLLTKVNADDLIQRIREWRKLAGLGSSSTLRSRDPLVGRKVMTRWPEDTNFYEAVISDYNPVDGRHALVYDVNTPNETWEWVDLKEVEKVIDASPPNLIEIQKAKKMLKDHEKSLMDVIAKLADACDRGNDGQQILHRNSQYNHLRVDIDPETRGRGSSQEMARVQGISDQQDEEIVVI